MQPARRAAGDSEGRHIQHGANGDTAADRGFEYVVEELRSRGRGSKSASP